MIMLSDNMTMNNSELRQMRILLKKVEQLEQELEWAKKELRELKCQ